MRRKFSVVRAMRGGVLAGASQQPDVYSVTPNAPVTVTVKNPQKMGRWAAHRLVPGLADLHEAGLRGCDDRAIVDSGVDTSNKKFGNGLLTQVDLASIAPSTRADGRGHGTFVAGILASTGAYGAAAPDANLVSLKVFNDLGVGTTSDVLRACDWLLQNKDRHNIRVANFSHESGRATSFRFDPLDRAVEKLWQAGIVVVVAGGNDATDGQRNGVLFSPANDPFVITVGALDDNGSPSLAVDVNAPWSPYGYTVDGFAKPDIAAPCRYVIEWVPANTSLAAERPYAVLKEGMQPPARRSLRASSRASRPTCSACIPPGRPTRSKLVADPDGRPYPVFDSASWLKVAQGEASWNTASWNSASWSSDSFTSASWNTASWLKVLVTDNAASDTGGDG